MSGFGHADDMVRRSKEVREQKTKRYNHRKKLTDMYLGSNNCPTDPDITAEDLDRIQNEVQEKDRQERNYFSRMTLIAICVLLVITLSALYIFNII